MMLCYCFNDAMLLFQWCYVTISMMLCYCFNDVMLLFQCFNVYCYVYCLLLNGFNSWNHLTVSKIMISSSFKNVIKKICLLIIYIWCICISRIRHYITYKRWYAIKSNQTTHIHKHHPHTFSYIKYIWYGNEYFVDNFLKRGKAHLLAHR